MFPGVNFWSFSILYPAKDRNTLIILKLEMIKFSRYTLFEINLEIMSNVAGIPGKTS